jgi:hypothetical protein
MKTLQLVQSLCIGAACFVFGGRADAQTTQTLGAGSAVTSIDRSATFDSLVVNGIALSDYAEGGLFVTVDGDSWVGEGVPVFDPFHGANNPDRAFEFPYGGSQGWVMIQTTDSGPIFAVEFMYGNGWTTGDVYGPYPWGNHDAIVEWQTWRGSSMVSSGIIGVAPILEMGTVLGFNDAAGFDQLLVRCTIASSGDPNLQALALDSVHVQLSAGCPAASVMQQPSPATTCRTGGAIFSVAAAGIGPMTYQWQRETAPNSNTFVALADGPTASWDGGGAGVGAIVLGSSTDTLSIVADTSHGRVLSAAHAIRYRCTVSNACSATDTDSAAVQLTVRAADFNCDGTVNSQDFFDFLNAFFASAPEADFNADGTVNSQDFFDFVNAFFAGG